MIINNSKILTKTIFNIPMRNKIYRPRNNWMILENIINFNRQILIFKIESCQFMIINSYMGM